MIRRALPTRLLLPVLALGALALGAPAASLAGEPGATTTPSSTPGEGSVGSMPTPAAPATPTSGGEPAASEAPPAEEPAPPQVQSQHRQSTSPGGSSGRGGVTSSSTGAHGGEGTATSEGSSANGVRARRRAPSPTTLTPSLPFSLQSGIGGVPGFFIESFQIPPFLLPIFQAAGTAYGIPWQVLAAINEVETDYGRDLSISSAGAEGWMQFLPSEWAQYGVDANGDGCEGPVQPGRRDLRRRAVPARRRRQHQHQGRDLLLQPLARRTSNR